ncbi:hypothetical protein D9M68_840390 [compost metagenome]
MVLTLVHPVHRLLDAVVAQAEGAFGVFGSTGRAVVERQVVGLVGRALLDEGERGVVAGVALVERQLADVAAHSGTADQKFSWRSSMIRNCSARSRRNPRTVPCRALQMAVVKVLPRVSRMRARHSPLIRWISPRASSMSRSASSLA